MTDTTGVSSASTATAAEIVDLMRERVLVGESEMARRYGEPAVEIALEMEAALMSAMESSLSYVVLWEQFLSTPDEVALAVVSVLQALMEADLVLAQWLDEAIARFRQAATAQTPLAEDPSRS